MYKESIIFNGYSASYDEWYDFFRSHQLSEMSTLLNIYIMGYFSICKREIHLYEYHMILNDCKMISHHFMSYYHIDEEMN